MSMIWVFASTGLWSTETAWCLALGCLVTGWILPAISSEILIVYVLYCKVPGMLLSAPVSEHAVLCSSACVPVVHAVPKQLSGDSCAFIAGETSIASRADRQCQACSTPYAQAFQLTWPQAIAIFPERKHALLPYGRTPALSPTVAGQWDFGVA
jgi:hypothetical protein